METSTHLLLLLLLLTPPFTLCKGQGGQVLRYQAQVKDDAGVRVSDCWTRRPEPQEKLIRPETRYNHLYCTSIDKGGDKEGCRQQCHIIPSVGLDAIPHLTVSLLLDISCRVQEEEVEVLTWSNCEVKVGCQEEDRWTVKVFLHHKLYKYNLRSKRAQVHLLLEMSFEQGQFIPAMIRVDNETLVGRHWSGGGGHISGRVDRILLPPTTTGRTTPAVTIRVLDLFHYHLDKRETEYEVQYINNLVKNTVYPECLCAASPSSPKVTCQDGSRRLRGKDPNMEYFRPLRAIQDGVMEPSLQYGYWAVRREKETVLLTLFEPAQVEKIEMYTAGRQSVDVYLQTECIDNNAGHPSTLLFSATPQPHNDTSEVGWSDEGGMSKLTWRVNSGKIARTLEVTFIGDNLEVQGSPNVNIIYEIIIYGRSLYPPAPDVCGCFPGNMVGSQPYQDCRRCNCRGTSKEQRTCGGNKHCEPYLQSLTPTYGPVSGGTLLTLHGGWLKPKHQLNCNATRISLEKGNSCQTKLYSDDKIVCVTGSLDHPTSDTSPVLQVDVEISVSGAFYRIYQQDLTFTYRPDPVITDVTPYKAIFSSNHEISVMGENLDSVYLGEDDRPLVISLTNHQEHGRCSIRSSNVMICTMPRIKGDVEMEAGLGLHLAGLVKFRDMSSAIPHLGTFTIYPAPNFLKQGITSSGPTLTIKGESLSRCCTVKEYRVEVGRYNCSVLEVHQRYLRCELKILHFKQGVNYPIVVYWYNLRLEAGYYHTTESTSPPGHEAVIISVLTSVLITALIMVGAFIVPRWRRQRRFHQMWKDSDSHIYKDDSKSPSGDEQTDILSCLDPELRRTIRGSLITSKTVEVHEQIGQGNFGRVYRGKLSATDGREWQVALKTLIASAEMRTVKPEELNRFLREATIMRTFNHQNVLSLIGVCMDNGNLYVVLPYMANGDLHKHLSKKTFNLPEFNGYVLDIAAGMAYLSENNFIHCDLAARNCMVDASERVLVGDFGLAKDLFKTDYYRAGDKARPLPFKWMALESLETSHFTTKSDVWSYGVVMWEIYSLGAKPFPTVENIDMWSHLKRGMRLNKPYYCPQTIFYLMQQCWFADPAQRPTFTELLAQLVTILDTHTEDNTDPAYADRVILGKRNTQDQTVPEDGILKPPISDLEGGATRTRARPEKVSVGEKGMNRTPSNIGQSEVDQVKEVIADRPYRLPPAGEGDAMNEYLEMHRPPHIRKKNSMYSKPSKTTTKTRQRTGSEEEETQVHAHCEKINMQELDFDYFIPVDPSSKTKKQLENETSSDQSSGE